jgi:hypothetical protein
MRRVEAEFGDQVRITYVMGGLAREFTDPVAEARRWLEAGSSSGMPVDARMWLDAPPRASYPACLAVKAAAEQGLDGHFLRRAREGFAVRGLRLDNADALVSLAGEVPGMDVERFRIDLQSNHIVERLGADLDGARTGEWPRFEVAGAPVTDLRAAVLEAGASPGALPPVEEALARFGAMAEAEVARVCDLPGPRVLFELSKLALEFRVRREAGGLWVLGP